MEARDNLNNQQAYNLETQKVIRLVDYLSRLATLRTKVNRDIAEYQKVLWLSDVPHERECFTQAWGRAEEYENDEWLEVQNRPEPKLPTVPPSCEDWVNLPSLRNKDDLPELLPEITRQVSNPDWYDGSDQPETITQSERLEDNPETRQAWETYVEGKWLAWTEQHNAWKKVHDIYSALFTIHQEQLRLGEEYELVLGLGLLTWQTPSGQRVRRHLVVADAILQFEAGLGKFTVRPHTDGAKVRVELDMLDIEEQPARAEETAKASLVASEDDPWERGCVEGVLQALVHSINAQGEYDGSLEKKSIPGSRKPIVNYAPALVLRKRSSKGLTETLKRIKEQIEHGEEIPVEFADLAEIRPKDGHEPPNGPEEANITFDGEIFFPKPSNDEQRRIVDKMRYANGVLVQGPPGTGKSHTIANLICHLLATGQRILITAKTPRALQVLEGLLPDELRSLCINLLGSGLEERRSLESSVSGMLRKNEEWNENRATLERLELVERLRSLREEKAKLNRRLLAIRESETHSHSIAEGCYRGTAARIVEAVNRHRGDYEWFTDSVPLDKTCQIDRNDLHSLLVALRQFTPQVRAELRQEWPTSLPHTEYLDEGNDEDGIHEGYSQDCPNTTLNEFKYFVDSEKQAIEDEQNAASGADQQLAALLARNTFEVNSPIYETFTSFRDTCRRLRTKPYSWMNDALRDILCGNSSLWHELLRVTRDVIASIEELVVTADETRVELPDTTDVRSLHEDARILKEHIENGGKLGWGLFRPKPVKERLYVLKSVTIGGRPCVTVEHFSNLTDALHVRLECEKVWSYWKGRSEKIEGPYTLQLTALKSLGDALENALSLEERISQCREALKQCPGLDEPAWADEFQIERVISSCRFALARVRNRLATDTIQSIEAPISRMAVGSDAHPVAKELLSAIRNRDVDSFSECLNTIQDLDKQRQHLHEIDENLSQLRGILPQFTQSLEQTCNEPYWEERVQRIGDAWRWAQARYWIEEYIRQDDVPALNKRAKQIEDEVNSIIAKLAALHAWSFCFSRLKEDHRRNMKAWRKNVSKITKSGTGKQDFFHRREAQKNLNNCREAIPAWVMPLHRVWDTVDPKPGMFDVIIVDEASQCGFESLPLFYMAKKVLVVGDDKQISPEAEGLKLDAVTQLINQYLYDFEHKASFNINRSLFDHAELRYSSGHVVLREHFRCMPEIIQFSNDLCYSDTPLIPLRQHGPDRLPPLNHIYVSGGYREGKDYRTINRLEAEKIVEKIAELCRDSRYDKKTMGVVVLQGEAQAGLIEEQLLERLGAEEMENRRLVCGNPYSFQGDERDIMFLSLVAANNEKIGPFTKPADERRFNVAASRARDQMILFHSVTCDDLSIHDLRRRLLEFFENTRPQQIAGIDQNELERRATQDNRIVVKSPTPFDSWFEVDVALELLRKSFTVVSQYKFAGKQIDLVVEGGQAPLAIECDGDYWHGADRYEEDMQRQRQFERCGWEFFRVRESAFYANKENALAGLWRLLEERKIFPNSQCENKSREIDLEAEANQPSIIDNSADDTEDDDDSSGDFFTRTGRRVEDITETEIPDAIIQVLLKCPNHSCTLHSLTTRVLREIGVRTSGKPRQLFEVLTKRCATTLKNQRRIETYRAKNLRVRLVFQE